MPRSLPRLTEGDKATYGYQEHYRVSLTDLGNGHKEASITTYATLAELPAWWGQPDPLKVAPTEEENRARAARRAKAQVRKKCKVMGVNSLFTLTYHANVQDRDLVAKHWDAFRRRVLKVLPGFAYVAVLERQKRGAYHIHIATHRLPAVLNNRDGVKVKSWNLLRAIWRSVVGELGGNFDEAKRKFHAKSRSHKIASYVSKYVAKAFDQDEALDDKKRFWVSQGVKVPPAVVKLYERAQFADLIALVYEACGGLTGDTVTFLSAERGVFWMCSEKAG
jgi:hypothetical protein